MVARQQTTGKAVTIVVPVYGDWTSLAQCIDSLKKHVSEPHKILLVNDCGPKADIIEKRILESIRDQSLFSYSRNPENLGFVKTNNKAVFELDDTDNDILLLNSDTIVTEGFLEEMLAVLYASEKHGCVCPRSSNATIASIPFILRSKQLRNELDYSYDVYLRVKDLLPRYVAVPVTVGFCMLIKRSLIKTYGLFDEIYGLGYGEENDFCMRINAYGYSSILCNHAYVYHLESRSFSPEKKSALGKRNEATLFKRYPFYTDLVSKYVSVYIDPVDWFADFIGGPTSPIKVLIDLYHLPPAFMGTTRNALSLLQYLSAYKTKEKMEFVILAQKESSDFFDLTKYGLRIIYPQDLNEIFHVGYCPSQIFHVENLLMLNRFCYRVVFYLLDIIAIRSQHLLANDFNQRTVFEDSFLLADKIVTISKFTQEDTLDYFGDSIQQHRQKFVTIPQGFPSETFETSETTFAGKKSLDSFLSNPEGFVLVYGNNFPHKHIGNILPILEKATGRYLIIGPHNLHTISKKILILPSGKIPDSYIERVISACRAVVFPSVYEGFGLPIMEAAYYDKPLVLADTVINREVAGLAGITPLVYTYSRLEDLPKQIEKALTTRKDANIPSHASRNLRHLQDYNKEVVELLLSEAKRRDIDVKVLRERWQYFTHVFQYLDGRVSRAADTRLVIITLIRKNPRLYKFAKRIYHRLKG